MKGNNCRYLTAIGKVYGCRISLAVGVNFVVCDMLLIAGEQIDVAEDSRKTPFVLTFKITAETPFQNEYIQAIS